MADRLAGFRGQPEDDLSEGERLLMRQMAANAGLIALVQRSDAMKAWMETPAGKALQDVVEKRLSEYMGVWLAATDPFGDAVREAHSNARVCVGVINMIEEALASGDEPRRIAALSDAQANTELNR